nr:RNA-directed DNA polymerase, eukaryota, reverse transcriptase zinc-binding domain protein [Tanacetum cinerariifolium]
MQAAVHEMGPPGDGATISDGGVAVFDHSNILAILSSSSLASFSASSVVPGRDADVVVVTITNIKIASFSKGMSWTHGAQTPIVAHGTVSNCSRARITTRSVIGFHLFTPVPAFSNILTAVFGHLIKLLDISMNGLQGDIPGDGIGNLTQLVHLDMSLYRFNGSIPNQIFGLTSLAKDKGDLEVSSLYALNRGLMFKWVWRFFNQKSSLWKNVIKVIHGVDGRGVNIFDFKKLRLGNRETIKFWTDNWYHRGILKDLCHRLFALENCKDVTISAKMRDPHLEFFFRRGVGGSNMSSVLVEVVKSIKLVLMEDRWLWNLESSGEFSVSSIWMKIDELRLPRVSDKMRWVKYVPIKVKVFAWKVMVDALPTRFNLSRRGI